MVFTQYYLRLSEAFFTGLSDEIVTTKKENVEVILG